jgi:hypothetical protein
MEAEAARHLGPQHGERYLITSTGERIGWDICRNWDCMRSIAVCACPEGPRPPDYEPRLTKTDNSLAAVLARAAGSARGSDTAMPLPDAA